MRLKFAFSTGSRLVASFSVSEREQFSAAAMVDKILQIVGVFARLKPQMKGVRLGTQYFVMDEKQNVGAVTRSIAREFKLPNPLRQRRFDVNADFANYMFQPGNFETTSRLIRSVSLAGFSMNTPDIDARIVPLWSAFEALLPQPSKDKEASVRISHFADVIGPCILHDHFRSLFEVTYRNFKTCFGEVFSDHVGAKGIGETKAHKFANLIVQQDPFDEDFFKIFSDHPLARYRVGRMRRVFSNPKNVVDILDGLEKKVEWQLHRIYRERNSLVHSGSVTRAAEHLLENGYSYYQSILFLIERISRSVSIADSDQAIELVNIAYRRRKEILTGIVRDKTINDNEKPTNIMNVLFMEFSGEKAQ